MDECFDCTNAILICVLQKEPFDLLQLIDNDNEIVLFVLFLLPPFAMLDREHGYAVYCPIRLSVASSASLALPLILRKWLQVFRTVTHISYRRSNS
jgi:hypothetical protein